MSKMGGTRSNVWVLCCRVREQLLPRIWILTAIITNFTDLRQGNRDGGCGLSLHLAGACIQSEEMDSVSASLFWAYVRISH